MLTKDQKELRKTGLGGSDASKIVGHNKYSNAVDVYLVKIGEKEEKDIEDVSDLRCDPRHWGNELESVVARNYEVFEGKRVEEEAQLLRHPEYPWMIANIDRRIIGENAFLECKTAHEYKYKDWGDEYSDEMPEEYLFQCMHYAIVGNVDYVDCAVLIGGNKYRCYRYERNHEAESLLIEFERKFWLEHVLPRVPPVPATYQQASALWKTAQAKQKMLPAELMDHWRSYNAATRKIKELGEHIEYDKARLCDCLKEADTLLSPLGMVVATWKNQSTDRLDIKRLKKELPDIYEQYVNTTTTRVLRVKDLKDGQE